ncbi:family 20 glycosylhydrolase [candidate division KSB1 bacterium]|nr:family 20 glycosylhydrolase [candidate division KSB1 bacterium]
MHWRRTLVFFSLIVIAAGSVEAITLAGPWQAIHLLGYDHDADLQELAQALPGLAERGINVIILEIDYHFEFQSFPELRQGDAQISVDGARNLAAQCEKNGIRLIPQFQCLGHQSWAKQTFPLLTVYPELDLTPGAYPENEGIYCREWDPFNPRVNEIVFALMDEIIDALQADAMHIGMDEVFLIGDEHAVSTKDKDPAEVFAHVVNDMYNHLVTEKKVEMLMWGDRLINAEVIDYGEWEASRNGTAPAIDKVPKDIIICDWHYELSDAYESVPMFLEKGFRVLPSSWRNVEASQAFIAYSLTLDHPNMLGHLFTTWHKMDPKVLLEYEPMVKGIAQFESAQKR